MGVGCAIRISEYSFCSPRQHHAGMRGMYYAGSLTNSGVCAANNGWWWGVAAAENPTVVRP